MVPTPDCIRIVASVEKHHELDLTYRSGRLASTPGVGIRWVDSRKREDLRLEVALSRLSMVDKREFDVVAILH